MRKWLLITASVLCSASAMASDLSIQFDRELLLSARGPSSVGNYRQVLDLEGVVNAIGSGATSGGRNGSGGGSGGGKKGGGR